MHGKFEDINYIIARQEQDTVSNINLTTQLTFIRPILWIFQ